VLSICDRHDEHAVVTMNMLSRMSTVLAPEPQKVQSNSEAVRNRSSGYQQLVLMKSRRRIDLLERKTTPTLAWNAVN
jgi:hypothetical protein